MLNGELLQQAGIDYATGLEHFLHDNDFYAAVLAAFADDTVLDHAWEAFRSGDDAALLRAVHEAKGSSGNAQIMTVYDAAGALLTLLRGGAYTRGELAASFQRFASVYTAAREGIRAALA